MILYKYFGENRVDVLKSRTLRFTQPIYFNDPLEFLPLHSPQETEDTFELDWEDGLRAAYGELKSAGYHNLMGEEFRNAHSDSFREAFAEVKADPRLAALCHTANVDQILQSIALGALCLTERPDNLLMWSHYASECKGFALGFDVSHNWFQYKGDVLHYRLTKVTYDEKRPPEMQDAYFRKGLDWQYEQEWRMVCPLLDCDRVERTVFVKQFPSECVVAVMLGCRMRENKRVELMTLARALPNAKLFRTYPNVHDYRMEVVPYERAFHIPYFYIPRD
jgi:hypothetical protein